MKQTLSVTLCALCSAVSALAFATEEDLFLLYGDDDMVSIATGTYQPITKAPSTASIITAEDIKAAADCSIHPAFSELKDNIHVR